MPQAESADIRGRAGSNKLRRGDDIGNRYRIGSRVGSCCNPNRCCHRFHLDRVARSEKVPSKRVRVLRSSVWSSVRFSVCGGRSFAGISPDNQYRLSVSELQYVWRYYFGISKNNFWRCIGYAQQCLYSSVRVYMLFAIVFCSNYRANNYFGVQSVIALESHRIARNGLGRVHDIVIE